MLMQAFLEPYNASRPPESRVEVTNIPWGEYKDTLTQLALHDRGVGVSEVGAPVVNDLLAMNALRPFNGAELASLGGQSAFSKIAWENANRVVDGQVWAIPWLVDPRGFVYWRDMLAKAGVDEQTAFQGIENTEETLRRLQNAGYPKPISIPSTVNVNGQASCSWVWGAGGEFLSPNGRQAYVTQPAFLDGLHSFFRLAPYLAPNNGPDAFISRQCAVAYGSMWAVNDLISNANHPLRPQLGLALTPGPAYAGGSSLVIWKNTRNYQDAVQLIRYLTDREAQANYPVQIDHLPVRQEVLDQSPFSTDPILSGFVRMADTARPFPTIKMGGLLQTLYCASVARIWAHIASEPNLDLKDAIQDEMKTLSHRIETWFE
jgi:multiple sugar transport system substrate-binding protein